MQLDSLQQATQFSISPRRRAATPRKASSFARNRGDRAGSAVCERAKCSLASVPPTLVHQERAEEQVDVGRRRRGRRLAGRQAGELALQVVDPPWSPSHDRVPNLCQRRPGR